jgi:hypothetical protein
LQLDELFCTGRHANPDRAGAFCIRKSARAAKHNFERLNRCHGGLHHAAHVGRFRIAHVP